MSNPGNGAGSFYRIVLSDRVTELLHTLHVGAMEAGFGVAFVAAFRNIVQRLRTDPLTFGEPHYRLPTLQLQVRQAGVHPLIVDYAVHEEQHLVFVQGFKVLTS